MASFQTARGITDGGLFAGTQSASNSVTAVSEIQRRMQCQVKPGVTVKIVDGGKSNPPLRSKTKQSVNALTKNCSHF
jgi:hypothetical protein